MLYKVISDQFHYYRKLYAQYKVKRIAHRYTHDKIKNCSSSSNNNKHTMRNQIGRRLSIHFFHFVRCFFFYNFFRFIFIILLFERKKQTLHSDSKFTAATQKNKNVKYENTGGPYSFEKTNNKRKAKKKLIFFRNKIENNRSAGIYLIGNRKSTQYNVDIAATVLLVVTH